MFLLPEKQLTWLNTSNNKSFHSYCTHWTHNLEKFQHLLPGVSDMGLTFQINNLYWDLSNETFKLPQPLFMFILCLSMLIITRPRLHVFNIYTLFGVYVYIAFSFTYQKWGEHTNNKNRANKRVICEIEFKNFLFYRGSAYNQLNI